MNFAHCLHIVLVIAKYTDIFRGIFLVGALGDLVTWENLSMEEFFVGKENFREVGAGFPCIYYVNEGVRPLVFTSLFTLKCFSNFKRANYSN